MSSNIKAFTLAEVLITLVIIGIVAALTVPTLVSNYNKQVSVTRLKKVYSTIKNAAAASESENGPMAEWDYPPAQYGPIEDTKTFIDKYYVPYLKVVKECDSQLSGCIDRNYKSVSLSGAPVAGVYQYSLFLADGTLLTFFPNIPNDYFWLWIDINGYQKPNVVGKDIFIVDIFKHTSTDYKVQFWNGTGNQAVTRESLMNTEAYGCNKNSTGYQAGMNCGLLIMLDGWKISDDYPW